MIAIIAILAAMLLPALSAARERARSAACVNKLKQINTANYMYANDNHDYVSVNEVMRDATRNYEMCRGIYALTPGLKLLQGHYLGDGFQSITLSRDFCRNIFQCPSDTATYGYSGTQKKIVVDAEFTNVGWISYPSFTPNKAAAEASGFDHPSPRQLVGRDDPGLVYWSDTIAGNAASGVSNHPSTCNTAHLGGYVKSNPLTAEQNKAGAPWNHIPVCNFFDDVSAE
ncbi:hypothetical protein SDC9_130317 [bioreactor metagenome]|uniref:Type II secretion system protein G n=1 Tax=bioreactor metagenome TaxID=1076179 RepID=A0A645D1V4_9ZZZZ